MRLIEQLATLEQQGEDYISQPAKDARIEINRLRLALYNANRTSAGHAHNIIKAAWAETRDIVEHEK